MNRAQLKPAKVSSTASTDRRLTGVPVLLALLCLTAPLAAKPASPGGLTDGTHSQILESYGQLPLSFIENRGQTDQRVEYYVQTAAYNLWFTRRGHALRLLQGRGAEAKAHIIQVELLGANTEDVEGRARAAATVSYFTGPKKDWHTAIPTHSEIAYRQPWTGIDIAYKGDGGKLESIYTVAAHADPAQIKLRYSGQDSLKVDADGNLVYTTSVGAVRETAPTLYQDIDGQRVPVAGRYRLVDPATVGFKIAHYDHARPLVIDPTLIYAGFIGGSGIDEGLSIAVDGAGNAYVTGTTTSAAASFPISGGPDLSPNGSQDAFVAKVNSNGTGLLYAGYIGGTGEDIGYGIDVDPFGYAYVAGSTTSTAASFPVVAGPDVSHNGGDRDGWIAKVNLAGTALIYCGYIGGNDIDDAISVAVDDFGAAYVTGYTASNQATFPVIAGPDLTANGDFDAFVAKVTPAGTALLYSGFIGGNILDAASGIAVDSAGNAYVTGYTVSTAATFPEVGGPDLSHNGDFDAFVAKINAGGTNLVYAGYIGGSGTDIGFDIAVDSIGNAYVTGYTNSTQSTFPVLIGPDLTYNGGATDVFVTKVNVGGTGLTYSGFIGGSGIEGENGGIDVGIAVDSNNDAYVTGYTTSNELSFPVLGGPDLSYNGGDDAFVAKLKFDGSGLIYAGYIGGTANEAASGIAVDAGGNAYVVGYTTSTEASFPVRGGPDGIHNGGSDAFVAKISEVLFISNF